MSPATLSYAANAVLALAMLVIAVRWITRHRTAGRVDREPLYREGYNDGRRAVLESIGYEREVIHCTLGGWIKRERVLKIREFVTVGNLRVAESTRDIVVRSETDLRIVLETLQVAETAAQLWAGAAGPAARAAGALGRLASFRRAPGLPAV
ncbi:MAG TPA: hypothetical protein VF665_13685 [Longimicrobium sp.]|uniref:hypothetical protein n=1 Tax=Longimicrobium sp. TaxID=2029185 RepID=UPI002ED8FDED